MIELSPSAQSRLNEYLQELRRALLGTSSVDLADVERDVRDHIEAALAGHAIPVEASTLDNVLRTLGAPAQWLSEERSVSPLNVKEALLQFGRRLAGGPESYRLAYLSLASLIVCWLPLFAFRTGSEFNHLAVFTFVSFVLARGSLSLFGADRITSGQKWLLYPSLLIVYFPTIVVLLFGPAFVATSFIVRNAYHVNHLDASAQEAVIGGRLFTPMGMVFGIVAIAGASWLLVGACAAIFPGAVRACFHPFAGRLSRRARIGLAMIGLLMVIIGFAIVYQEPIRDRSGWLAF